MEIPIPPQLKPYGSPLPVFTLWFMFVYALGYFIVFRNWGKNYRPGAASCLMSLAHGTPALILSVLSILQSQSLLKLDFSSRNTAFQNLVLEYSAGYFLMDLLHYLAFAPRDALFIAHHAATLYVLATCRYAFGHGATAVLGILVVAEATTTCQNTWSLTRFRRADSARAAALFEALSPVFYGYYTGVRGLWAPLLVYGIIQGGSGGGRIPGWAWASWMVVTVGGIGASMLWVLHLWVDLYRHRSKKLS